MSDKFRFNNRSILISRRVRALFNKINREQSFRDRNDIVTNLSTMHSIFKELYSNLGKPSVKINPLENKQVPKSSQITKTMYQIEEDLRAAYDETKTLRSGFVEVFNHAQALSAELIKSAEQVSSKVVDLRLLNNQLDQQLIIAGDDFKDLSKIDTNFPLQNPVADILIDQGTVILKRISSSNLVNQNTNIKITPLAPTDLSNKPTVNNINRFYEGKFYDFIGNARPEGGRFHIEQTLAVNVQPTGVTVNTVTVNNPSPTNILNYVNEQLADNSSGGGKILSPEDIVIYDRGANEEEKNVVRKNLIDQNPATFWECEYVKVEPSIQDSVDQSKLLDLDDKSTLNSNDDNLGTITLDDLRNQSRALSASSSDDLIVEINIELDKEQLVNWISLVPANFNETAWIDVLEISYTKNNATAYNLISNFNNAIHDNTLTDEANAELTDAEKGSILAPNKYSYRGVGVWSFDPVVAKFIKIKLRQRSAIPAPYQRLAVRLHRTFTQVYSQSNASTPGI